MKKFQMQLKFKLFPTKREEIGELLICVFWTFCSPLLTEGAMNLTSASILHENESIGFPLPEKIVQTCLYLYFDIKNSIKTNEKPIIHIWVFYQTFICVSKLSILHFAQFLVNFFIHFGVVYSPNFFFASWRYTILEIRRKSKNKLVFQNQKVKSNMFYNNTYPAAVIGFGFFK